MHHTLLVYLPPLTSTHTHSLSSSLSLPSPLLSLSLISLSLCFQPLKLKHPKSQSLKLLFYLHSSSLNAFKFSLIEFKHHLVTQFCIFTQSSSLNSRLVYASAQFKISTSNRHLLSNRHLKPKTSKTELLIFPLKPVPPTVLPSQLKATPPTSSL